MRDGLVRASGPHYGCLRDPNLADDCWAEFIGSVIEITRQNTFISISSKGTGKNLAMTKDEIITRALIDNGFDPSDFGIPPPNE